VQTVCGLHVVPLGLARQFALVVAERAKRRALVGHVEDRPENPGHVGAAVDEGADHDTIRTSG
jgi:hypothetical protein